MSRLIILFTGLFFAVISPSIEAQIIPSPYAATCKEIAASVSSASKVYYFGSLQYSKDNYHWASSSSQSSACSFEPATAQDVGIALQIIANHQTPFSVKSAGASAVPGSSSTPGVQIALYSFSSVVYNASTQTATIGMGLIWDDVYAQLEQYGVTVVGAKFTGVGIGGMVLGGGYSYLSNQYGLSVDNVVALELVMPNGTVASITSSSNPDLFFGLRGGFNNFGIVTTVTMNTHPQSQVWGGRISYTADQWDAANTAMANFVANVTDPKACLHTTRDYLSGVVALSNVLFYDGPQKPDGIFDDFLAIPHIDQDLATRPYSNLIKTLPTNISAGLRGMFHWVPVEQFTLPILQMVENQTLFYGAELTQHSGKFISYEGIPLLPSLYSHSDIPSAFPSLRDPGQGHSFINVFYGWTNPSDDAVMQQVGAESVSYIKQFLVDAGQNVGNALVYPNGAPWGAPMVDMYGDALGRLHSIRSAVDPGNVMGLTGGWRF